MIESYGMNRGKLVLTAIVALGLAAAAFALWFRFEQGRRTIELWGADNVLLIRDAEVVELLRLAPAGEKAETVDTVSTPAGLAAVERQTDIGSAPGLVHLRVALIQDHSYAPAGAREKESHPGARWRYALRFRSGDENGQATFCLDLDQRLAWLVERSAGAELAPHLADGMKRFFEDVAGGEAELP